MTPEDRELIERYKDGVAPLLPILHAFHDRDGELTDSALRAISDGLRTPLADLYGTVTFYHHLSRGAIRKSSPRVCMGPVCRLRGADRILDSLGDEGAIPTACPGRCDDPVPVLRGDLVEIHDPKGVEVRPSALPTPNPGNVEECVFASIREPGRAGIDGYVATGGYEGLARAVEMGPDGVIAEITEAKLTGKGGAGFPTGTKWKAVREAPGTPKTIVCNADEGEPGCFMDRAVMDHDPHALIEGMVIAGLATGASRGIIYLRYEYPATRAILERALAEAESAGHAGENVHGSGFDFPICVRRGGGAYICGEETSLLNSLEGKHPYPRNRPPYPVTNGFEDLPTAVNNVETLAIVPQVMRRGAAWYRGLGLNGHAGTKVISLSGDVCRPGNYEVPIGLPLRTLLDEWAGGAPEGRSIQAVTMAGLSGGFLAGEDLDVSLDEPSIRARGAFLGAGGIMVFDDTRDIVSVARSGIAFFAEESCGKCFPCRIGTQRMTERLAGTHGPRDMASWAKEIEDLSFTMKATSACGLGQAAPLIVESLMKYFPDAVNELVSKR